MECIYLYFWKIKDRGENNWVHHMNLFKRKKKKYVCKINTLKSFKQPYTSITSFWDKD